MNYTIYLNAWNYPNDALHVHFASGMVKKSMREQIETFIWGEKVRKAELSSFVSDFAMADHVVFHGGDTPTLLEYLRSDIEWMDYLNGKTLWGFSAGISAMAYRSFNIDHKRIITGMELFPFQTIVHFNQSTMNYMVNDLYRDCGLPVLTIPDHMAFRISIDDFYCKLEVIND